MRRFACIPLSIWFMNDVSYLEPSLFQTPSSYELQAPRRCDDAEHMPWHPTLPRDYCHLAHALWQAGAPDDAAAVYLYTLKHVRSAPTPDPILATLALGMSLVCYEWNLLAEAQQCLEYGLDSAHLYGDVPNLISGHIIQAAVCLANRDHHGAQAALDQATQQAQHSGSAALMRSVELHRAWCALRTGDIARAASWAQRTRLCTNVAMTPDDADAYVVYSGLLIAQHRGHEAVRLGMRLYDLAAPFDTRRTMLGSLLIQVLGFAALGEERLANQTLCHALLLAAPAGALRCFLDYGAPLLERVQALSMAEGFTPAPSFPAAFVTQLLDAWHHSQHALPARKTSEPCPPQDGMVVPSEVRSFLVPLTPREHEIIRWIAEGLTTKAIAQRLTVTPGTVKWHIENIYSKLAVRTRTQAVAQARRLGLLD